MLSVLAAIAHLHVPGLTIVPTLHLYHYINVNGYRDAGLILRVRTIFG
jgi:hypothetical protein